MSTIVIRVKRFPKHCQWRNPRIARLGSLVAAINREIDHLKWV